MADLFQLLSAEIPFDSLVKRIGGVPPARRGSVVKLLGDSSLLPNQNLSNVIGDQGIHTKANLRRISLVSDSNMFDHVLQFGNSKLSQHYQLLEGAEKFLKSTEMIGRYLLDQKDFQHYCESQFSRLESEVNNRISKVEFFSTLDENINKLNNETKTSIKNFEERLHKLEVNLTK